MARVTKEQAQQLRDLEAVKRIAESDMTYWLNEAKKKPMAGWSEDNHIAYCLRRADEAQTAYNFCLVYQMRIDPD